MRLSRKVIITIDTNGTEVLGTVTSPCDNDKCPEPQHTETFHSAKDMAVELTEWASVMLAAVKPEGSA